MEWENLSVKSVPELKGKLSVGVKYGKDGQNVALSVAVKTADDKVFIESIDCRDIKIGNTWILEFITKSQPQTVVVDGANGQNILSIEMKKEGLKTPILPTVKDVITANAMFEQGIFRENIVHMNQPSLAEVASNCEKRAIGTNGGFGYKSQKTIQYELSIPKGDTNNWVDTEVEFFGQKFMTVGYPEELIEEMVPLSWNKKVKVERYG